MSNWREFTNTGELDAALAEHIAGRLAQDIEARGTASLAVSGGSTPKPLFQQLSQRELDWASVQITLVDERWVGPDEADSNERLVRENLLQNHAAAAQFIGLKTSHATGEEGLEEARQRVADIAMPFTLVVLGMGGDGHTASWFPQADNLASLLNAAGEATVDLCDPVTAPHQRITFTFPAVTHSREIIVHIVGAQKREVLASAREQALPIAAVLDQQAAPVTIWWSP